MAKHAIVMVRLDRHQRDLYSRAASAESLPISAWMRKVCDNIVDPERGPDDWEKQALMRFGVGPVQVMGQAFGAVWGRMDWRERYQAVENQVERGMQEI